MELNSNIPDFILVGAPKCGTTALDYHLNLHPELFMAEKELHFFGNDIGIIQDELNQKDYLEKFSEAQSDQIKGESSVWYLYSCLAPEEIKELNPNTKIIILLRKPTEMIPSLHGQYLFNGIESNKSFTEAFQKDMQQKDRQPCALFKKRPKYLESALYSKHVERYLKAFGREQVLVLLHEELKGDFNTTFQRTLKFIGVKDTDFQPNIEQINKRKTVKNVGLHQMSKTPPSGLKKIFRTLIPSKKVRHSIMQWVEDKNIQEEKVRPVDESVKQKIIDLTHEDVKSLSSLIQKDLTHWNS